MDQTLALLVADDPQGQARKLLDHVVARCEAKTGAVVTVAGGDLGSFAGEVPLSHLAALQRLWMAEEQELRAGRPLVRNGFAILPLIDDKELSGLLFVEGGNPLEPKNTAVVALTATLRVAQERLAHPNRAAEIETGVGAETERRRLLAALDRHEWNIARVARLAGVTRRTIYLRLRRYKIDRKRVPKTLKPCPPLQGV